jgi:hypothetical protein
MKPKRAVCTYKTKKLRKPAVEKQLLVKKPAECEHTIFLFTPKKTQQVCVQCGARRSFCLEEGQLATVGKWKAAKHNVAA